MTIEECYNVVRITGRIILQQDPIRWAPVTNIYISGQPMFRTEFIDK